MKIFRTMAAAAAGVAYGMFFAQKKGSELREELKKSKNPAKHLFEEVKNMAEDSGNTAMEALKDSKELQAVIKSGKDQFDALVESSKKLGAESMEELKHHLEELAENAKKAARDLTMKAKNSAEKFKNEIEKDLGDGMEKVKKSMK